MRATKILKNNRILFKTIIDNLMTIIDNSRIVFLYKNTLVCTRYKNIQKYRGYRNGIYLVLMPHFV